MGLADRLRAKGVEVNIGQTPIGTPSLQSLSASSSKELFSSTSSSSRRGGKSTDTPAAPPVAVPVHVPLAASEKLTKKLFTPLSEQGAKAIATEKRLKEEDDEDLLGKVRKTLKQWVQDCLVSTEKRDKFIEKGMLKCRVQAKWSEGLHGKLKALICEGGYGGRLAADGEKENRDGKADTPWIVRNERWVVGFDAAAFERFIKAHPEVVEPSEKRVLQFLEEYAKGGRGKAELLKGLDAALREKFGPLRQASLDRARRLLTLGGQQARPLRIETNVDLAWAAAVMAPWGLRKGTVEPVIRSPSSWVLPILDGLKTIDGMPNLQSLLQESQIGKVVNGLRHHSNPEVVATAKKLVESWRRAVTGSGKSAPAAAPVESAQKRPAPVAQQSRGEQTAKRHRSDAPDKKAAAQPGDEEDDACEAFWSSF